MSLFCSQRQAGSSIYFCLPGPSGLQQCCLLKVPVPRGVKYHSKPELKPSERVLASPNRVFLPFDMIIHDITSQIAFKRESGQTEQASIGKTRIFYHSVTVLSSLYSLNINNCHCDPQE